MHYFRLLRNFSSASFSVKCTPVDRKTKNKKIERNIERDKEVNEELTKQDWTILRFWGKDIEKNLLSCVLQIESEIKNLKMEMGNPWR